MVPRRADPSGADRVGDREEGDRSLTDDRPGHAGCVAEASERPGGDVRVHRCDPVLAEARVHARRRQLLPDQPVPCAEARISPGSNRRLRRAAIRLPDRQEGGLHPRPEHVRPGRGHGYAPGCESGRHRGGDLRRARRVQAAGGRDHRARPPRIPRPSNRSRPSIPCRPRWRSWRPTSTSRILRT